MKVKTAIGLVTVIELVLIAFFGLRIINQKPAVSVTKLDKNQIEVKGSKNLLYFFDLTPGQINTYAFPWLPEKIHYTINKDALNDRLDYDVNKAKGTFRIVALGDSFTFGQFVSTKDNWTEVLEDKLKDLKCDNYNRIEVINLGVQGYDVEYAVERFRLRGKKYNPDLIVWMLTDSTRIVEKLYPWISECAKNSTRSADTAPQYLCWDQAQEKLLSVYGKDNVEQYIAEKLDSIYDIYNGKILAVNLDWTFEGIFEKSQKSDKFSKINLGYIWRTDYQLEDKHPNTKGHEYFADRIYKHLTNNRIIDCEK